MNTDFFASFDRSRPVVAALSGGVDSAVAAALAKRAGLDVVAITMRLYDAGGTLASSGGRCCGPRDIEDARRVANHLGIPFYVADYESVFNERVVDDFVREYQHGRTPNPCARCNQHIKFTPLLRRARALGAQALLTGHYARLTGPRGARRLFRAVDAHKDQSYFLFHMPREAFDDVYFPLGDLTKDHVRDLARDLGLPNAEKPESQEICFVPDGNYAGFVAKKLGDALPSSGAIVDESGAVLGEHRGVHHFTVGQRRGIGVGSAAGPLYVLRVLPEEQKVVVGHTPIAEKTLLVDELTALPELPHDGLPIQVQIRYRHAAQPARLFRVDAERVRVELDTPERSPAAGQAAVFYQDAEVLGGGFIRSTGA